MVSGEAVVVGCSIGGSEAGAPPIVELVTISAGSVVTGPDGVVGLGLSVVDGCRTVGGVGPGPVLGGVEEDFSVDVGAAVVTGVVVLGAVVDETDCSVLEGAAVVGGLVVEVVDCPTHTAEVSAAATDGPAGGVGGAVVATAVVVVDGRMTDAVSAVSSSGAEIAVG